MTEDYKSHTWVLAHPNTVVKYLCKGFWRNVRTCFSYTLRNQTAIISIPQRETHVSYRHVMTTNERNDVSERYRYTIEPEVLFSWLQKWSNHTAQCFRCFPPPAKCGSFSLHFLLVSMLYFSKYIVQLMMFMLITTAGRICLWSNRNRHFVFKLKLRFSSLTGKTVIRFPSWIFWFVSKLKRACSLQFVNSCTGNLFIFQKKWNFHLSERHLLFYILLWYCSTAKCFIVYLVQRYVCT